MPILSLTQNITSVREGMNQIGSIRKGAPKKADRPGEDLPYFRIILNPEYQHLQPVINDLFGDKPEWFEGAHVLEDTADKAFSFWLEEWGGGGTLYHRCDGESQVQWYDGKQYQFGRPGLSKMKCEAPACNCARVGRLALWFESLLVATGELGYFTVYTSSKNDIVEVQKQLAAAEYLAAMAGKSLISVPMIFGRYFKAISSPAFKKVDGEYVRTDKRKMIDKSLFAIRIDPRWNTNVLLPAMQQAAVLPPPAEDKPVSELRLADATRARARALIGPSAPHRLDTGLNRPEPTEPPLTIVTSTASNPVEMTPPPVDDYEDDEPDVIETPTEDNEAEADEILTTSTFVSHKIKYINAPNSAYVLFAGESQGDDPARLYGRDLLRDLGEPFTTFANNLTPGPATQEPIALPESLSVTAIEKVSEGGVTYYIVTKLARVEAVEDAPEQKAKAS